MASWRLCVPTHLSSAPALPLKHPARCCLQSSLHLQGSSDTKLQPTDNSIQSPSDKLPKDKSANDKPASTQLPKDAATSDSKTPLPTSGLNPNAQPIAPLSSATLFFSQPVVAAFCAGGVAGAVSRTVVSPLERLKILFQVQSAGRNEYKLSVGKALAKMWREEGWRGFMRGNGTNCIRIVPYSAVQFGSYNFYKRSVFESYPGADLSPLMRLVCGGLAGITSVTFTYPLDIVRTRLSIQTASFANLAADKQKVVGMWATMKGMYVNEGGFVALYRGIVPTVAGVAPYVGLNFMVYEHLRGILTPEGDKNPSAVRKLAAGAISGAVAQTCTYPL